MARRISREKYGIVQSGTPNPLGILAAITSRKAGCPLVNIYHTSLDRFEAILAADKVTPEWVVPASHVELGEIKLKFGGRELAVKDLEAVSRCNKHDKSL